MKSKPARYGIKFWSLVDVNFKYLLDINIYLRKKGTDDKKETQLGMKVVLDLIKPYFKSKRSS